MNRANVDVSRDSKKKPSRKSQVVTQGKNKIYASETVQVKRTKEEEARARMKENIRPYPHIIYRIDAQKNSYVLKSNLE